VTSTLTTAEVIYMKGAPKLAPEKRPLVNNFFRQAHVVQKPLIRQIAEMARDIVWDFNIKSKDAIHIATAAYYKIGKFHTFDGDLLALKTITIGPTTIVLQEPYAQRQMELIPVKDFPAKEVRAGSAEEVATPEKKTQAKKEEPPIEAAKDVAKEVPK
jgi:hypothetical protein